MSQGLKPLCNSDRSVLIDFQNAVLAGSRNRGPQVVIANYPPERTQSRSLAGALANGWDLVIIGALILRLRRVQVYLFYDRTDNRRVSDV